MAKRKKLYALITAVVLILLAASAMVLHDTADRKDQNYRQRARECYAAGDYETALLYLRRISSGDDDQEILMLMADCYEATGNYPRALEALRRMNTGDPAIASRIQSIEQKKDLQSRSEVITIAGMEFERDVKEANFDGKGITDEELKEITALYALDSLSLRDNLITDIRLLASLGGLDALDLSGNAVHDISALGNLKELRSLNLDGNPISDFSVLLKLNKLNSLYVSGTEIQEDQLEEIAAALPTCTIRCETDGREEILLGSVRFYTDVTELDLSEKGLLDVSALGECSELTTLVLSGNSVSDLMPLMKLPKLVKLNISDNLVSDLRPLIGLPLLTELNASGNQIQDTSAVGAIKQLRSLDLSRNQLLNYSGLGRLEKLETLYLKGTGLADSDLSEFGELTALRILDIQDNAGLSDRSISALRSKLTGCSILCSDLIYEIDFSGHLVRSNEKSLSFPSCGISTITGLDRLTELEELNLRGNEITNLYPFEISGVRTSLRILNLADNYIDEIGSLTALSAVEELDLSGNGIVEPNALMQLRTLRKLNLSGNPLSEEQIERLRTALPECEIVF